MVTTVTNNSPQSINTSLFSLQKEIDDLRRQINQIMAKNGKDTATPENQFADKDFVNSRIDSVNSEISSIKSDIDGINTELDSKIDISSGFFDVTSGNGVAVIPSSGYSWSSFFACGVSEGHGSWIGWGKVEEDTLYWNRLDSGSADNVTVTKTSAGITFTNSGPYAIRIRGIFSPHP